MQHNFAGMGGFIGHHMFPGNELLPVSAVLRSLARANLERLTKLSVAALARRSVVGSTGGTTRRDNDARGVLLAALRRGCGCGPTESVPHNLQSVRRWPYKRGAGQELRF